MTSVDDGLAMLLPLLLIPLIFVFGGIGSRISPFVLGPRYDDLPSLEKLLKVNWVVGFLVFATNCALFGVVLSIFDTQSARYFSLAAVVFLYLALFTIGFARKNDADNLVSVIRAARDLSDAKCLSEDVKRIRAGATIRSKRVDFSFIARYSEILKAADARPKPLPPKGNHASFWIGFAFLTLLPAYGYFYVLQNFEQLKELAVAVNPASRASTPVDLLIEIFFTKLAGTCAPELKGCPPALLHLQTLQTQTFIVALQFFYFLLMIFFPIRYLAMLFEYRTLLRWTRNHGLGLETDVVKKSGMVVCVLVALIAALILVNVPFGQIGVFSGIAAAGLSVALRDTLGNLLAGALLIWDGTLKKGDVITIPKSESSDTGSTYGIVREMRMRYTIVEDRNTVRRLIPNATLVAHPIESWTHEDRKVRLNLRIGVAYGTDLREAKQIMESVCYDVPRILSERAPQALVIRYGDSAIDFSLRFWLRDTAEGIRPVISEVLINLWDRFAEAKIQIPFPQQDIHIYRHRQGVAKSDADDSAVLEDPSTQAIQHASA